MDPVHFVTNSVIKTFSEQCLDIA